MNAGPPRIYECEVMHQRLRPRKHGFVYRVFMIDVDLDDLGRVDRSVLGLGCNRFNLFSIDDRDHVDVGMAGIRDNLLRWLDTQGVSFPEEISIRLVTFPRVLGYGFNPVSFYYLHSANGDPLMAVAEVTNTFREMKLFVVDQPDDEDGWRKQVSKNFYVSPFSDPADRFEFRLGNPGDRWDVHIDDVDEAGKVLVSTIRGTAFPLTSGRLIGCAFRYPLLSFKIIGGIHWHAFLLWLRKIPFFRKADRPQVQTDVLRPHASLKRSSP